MRATEGDRSRHAVSSFGYHVRRRRLALDLTQAALASRVGCSTATVKKIEQDQRRPSRTMARRLGESLEHEDVDLFVAVAIGEVAPSRLGETGPWPSARETAARPPNGSGDALPAWLARAAASPPATVVGRGHELEQLAGHLRDAAAGDGRVVFVTGEAGQGKTSLLSAFAARAQGDVPNLVVARGYGTAASGLGDPYLPFRDVLSMLLVDPAARWQADHLDLAQASALWRFAPTVAATLVRDGPHLLDLVVPASTVATRLDGHTLPSERDAGHAPGSQVVAQLTATLVALAEQRPLLVLLDDLQWADVASTELLFHLSRRLAHSRLLVVAAFRSSEVLAADPASEPARAALRRTVLEIERFDSGRGIDLGALDPDGSRALSDSLVDLEPNRLDDDFRSRLFELTRGHPLFVLELLQELRSTGELVQDDDGRWTPGADLDWGAVPPRVHAVIEQRLSRVTPEARSALEIASVIGEHFTPGVIARVTGADEGDVLRTLSRELDREHHLVRETGAAVVAGREVARFRFAHALFQQDLYAALGSGERRDLHGRVAAALTESHPAEDDALLPLLAHHYSEAGDLERAVEHLVRAGDRARDVYANDEAIHLYARAVGFLRNEGNDGRLGRTLMKLALSHQLAFDHERAQLAYDEAFALLAIRSTTRPAAVTATLRMAWNEPASLDPTLGGYDLAAPVATQLFRGLVAYGHDLEVLPDLAERWELHDGGRRYVFHLRDDVVWSDGVPVTAHDVEFTYRRALDPDLDAPVAPALLAAVQGARELRQGVPPAEVVFGVRADDDRTVVIELEEPTAYFIHNLAYYVLLVVPRHIVSAAGPAWAQPPTLVGNGPFVVTSWERGQHLRLERNPRYRGSASGNVARVDLDLTPGADVAQLYLDDRIDVVPGWFAPPPALDLLLRRRPDETAVEEQFGTIYYATGPRPPLDDVRVRQALAMAVDRGAVGRGGWGDASRPAPGGFVPPGMPGASEHRMPFDRAEATRTLTETGVLDGRGLTVAARPASAVTAERLADQWRAVGLGCRVMLVEGRADDVYDHADVVLAGWWADYPDPDNFLRVCVELAVPHWQHARYAEHLAAAARSDVQADRLQHYAAAELILAEEAVLVPLLHPRQLIATKPWVEGYRMLRVKHPGSWKDITIDRAAGAIGAS